jgi:hypothetical protein
MSDKSEEYEMTSVLPTDAPFSLVAATGTREKVDLLASTKS